MGVPTALRGEAELHAVVSATENTAKDASDTRR